MEKPTKTRWQYCHLSTKLIEGNWLWGSDTDRFVIYKDYSDSTGKVSTETSEIPITLPRHSSFRCLKYESHDRRRNLAFYFDNVLFSLGDNGWELITYQISMPTFIGIHIDAILKKPAE